MYALLDEDDRKHSRAASVWRMLLVEAEARIMTHGYVVVEAAALVQRRLGMDAAPQLTGGLLPAVEVEMVDAQTHQQAVGRWERSDSRVSLVDVTSFVFMEQRGIARAFAFDTDFTQAGFEGVT